MARPVNKNNPITLAQVLSHNKRWTEDDRQIILEHIERLNVVSYFLQDCGYDVNLFNGEDWVAWITHGRIIFRPGFAPPEAQSAHWREYRYIPLSTTIGDHYHRAATKSVEEPVCPSCFMVLPKTGQCDNCD